MSKDKNAKNSNAMSINSQDSFISQFLSLSNVVRPELVVFYLLLRKEGYNRRDILEGLQVSDPFSFFGKKSITNLVIHLGEDINKLSDTTWEKLESLNRRVEEASEVKSRHRVINNLLIITGHTFEGPQKFRLRTQLANFLLSLLNIKGKETVYNPFAGTGSLGRALEEGVHYYGQEIDPRTWLLGNLFLLNLGDSEKTIVLEDSIKNWQAPSGSNDIIIANPPYRTFADEFLKTSFGKTSKLEEIALYNSTQNLRGEQQTLLLLPSNILTSNGAFIRNYRKFLVDSGLLSTIVQFPPGVIFHSTVKLCALLFKLKADIRGEQVTMIDLTNEINTENKLDLENLERVSNEIISGKAKGYIRKVPQEHIEENNYNLDVSRYWLPEISGENLFEVFIGNQGTRIDVSSKDKWSDNFPMVRIKDLRNDPISFELKANDLEKNSALPKGGKLVEENSLLISKKFNSLRPTWLVIQDQPVWISSDILAVKINKKKVYLPFLVQELHSETVKAQVKAFSSGATIKSIRRADLRRIKVDLPDLDTQKARVAAFRKNVLIKEEEKLAALKREYGVNEADSLSFLRHSLAKNIKNSNDVVEDLEKIFNDLAREKCKEIFDTTDDSGSTLTLAKNLDILKRELIEAREVLRRASLDIDLKNKKEDKILLFDFVKNYAEELRTLNRQKYEVSFRYDDVVLSEKQKKQIYLIGDKKLLKRAFDNIVDNACKHGFSGIPVDQRKLLIGILYSEGEDYIQIDFGNTGNPLPEDYTIGKLVRKGSRTGTNAGDGYGGYLIHKIVEAHNGSVDIKDETGPEGMGGFYVTSFEVNLPIQIKIEV